MILMRGDLLAARRKPGIEVREGTDGSRTYRIRWRQDGRNLSHSYTREKEAVDARARIIAAGNRCSCSTHAPAVESPAPGLDGGLLTFGHYARRHVANLTGVGPGYRARFARELELHFADFHDQDLDAITDVSVREWIRGMEDGTHLWLLRHDKATDEWHPHPRSATTIRRLLAQAGAVLASAQSEGLAARNPFKGHRLGRRDRDQHTEMTVLTHEEWAILQAAIPAGVYRDLATVMIGTGMRWGEASALGPGHVDPFATPPVLHVARAWQDNGQGGYQLGTPKSRRSRRTVEYAGAVLEALIPHLAGARDYVFTTPSGAPIRHSNYYNRVWLPSLDRAAAAGLTKRPRIHDLRHTHASWCITGGMDIAAVSRRLGHETTALTVDTYYHLMPQTSALALSILEQAMPTQRRD